MTTDTSPTTPGWKSLVFVLLLYLACLAIVTWPAFATFGTRLPSRVDPISHLWTMRWYKSCLIEGRLPFFCREIQYPVGAPLGTLPPMHFQTLLYLPLSCVFDNDVLCYNVIRTVSFLLTGVGTFLLIWHFLRSRSAAGLGGLLAMISTPMLYFSHGELEQITVGWFPIFLIAWLRFVDRPSGRGLGWSIGLYAMVAMSAPYFGVFAVFPSVLYVIWRAIAEGRAGVVSWWKARLGWFLGFAGVVAPIMILLFSNQIWALTHGMAMARPDAEFAKFRAPLWGYLVPPPGNLLSRWLPFETSVQGEVGPIPSYLGVVTLGLIVYAAASRVRFPRRAYWWAVLGLLVVLSMGGHARVIGHELTLPAAWLKAHFVGFRMIRVPARFNLFASVIAALVASAGLRHLLVKLPGRPARVATCAVLAAMALADLSVLPYPTRDLPTMPNCYQVIRSTDPGATFLEVPQFNSGAFELPSLCTYWQSFHGGKTSAGYTAFLNVNYDNLLYHNSPFDAFRLARVDYLEAPGDMEIELTRGVDFRSYAWLYLKVHGLRYVVVHRQAAAFPEFAVHLDRLDTLLEDAKIFQDEATTVYDRDRLPLPTRSVMLYAEGWGDRSMKNDRRACMVGQVARVHVYNPTPEEPLTFRLDAIANRTSRIVTLKSDGRELARWDAPLNAEVRLESPPLQLESGLRELTIESDGEALAPRADWAAFGSTAPFSFWATRVGLAPTRKLEAIAGATERSSVAR